MKMTYIPRIQGNMKCYKTIYTKKVTSRIIDGSYNSIYKGRSMNFDELREYVPSDDVKDIDWKASARSQKMLVRQYIAEKKHNIMLVMDTNRNMLAHANDTEEKKDVALLAAGTLAYMVSQNGDYVSATLVKEGKVSFHPFKTGLFNLEMILAEYDRAVTMDNHSSIETSLEYIARNLRRRMIILIVTDTDGIMDISDSTIKQLRVMHDILLVNVCDADLFGKKVFDMNSDTYLPAFFTEDKKLAKIDRSLTQQSIRQCDDKLKRLGISNIPINSGADMDEKIAELLDKHKTGDSR